MTKKQGLNKKEGSLVVDLKNHKADTNTKKKRGNKEKKRNGYRCQTKNLLYTHASLSWRKCQEKPEVTPVRASPIQILKK